MACAAPGHFPCSNCEKSLEFRTALKAHYSWTHVRKVPVDNRYKLSANPTCMESIGSLLLQQPETNKPKSHRHCKQYKCKFCSQVFTTPKELNLHRDLCHNSNAVTLPLQCNICPSPRRFAYIQNLKQHVLEAHPEEKDFHCIRCSASFLTSLDWRFHIQREHRWRKPLGTILSHQVALRATTALIAPTCSGLVHQPTESQQFREEKTDKNEVNSRNFLDQKEKLLTLICSQRTQNLGSTTLNREPPEEIQPRSPDKISLNSKCSEGAGSEVRKSLLSKRNNSLVFDYSCSECDQTFCTSAGLSIHRRRHSGERPFSCFYCKFASFHSSQLQLHMKGHTAVNKFKCSHCPFWESNTVWIDWHMKHFH